MNARNGLPKPLTYMLALVGQLSTRRTSLVQEIPKRCHEPGYDWTRKYHWIVEAALKNRIKHFVVDGEAVILGVDGVSDFNALHSGQQNEEVQLCAFDVLAMDGDDLRKLPLTMRKTNLARLLARRPEGIFVNPFEQGEIGPDLFRKACEFGLEGLVSKRRDRPYQPGRSKHWVKVSTRRSYRIGWADAFEKVVQRRGSVEDR